MKYQAISNNSSNGSVIPAANYLCQVFDAKESVTSQKGTPQVNVSLKIVEGEYVGRTIFDNLVFTTNRPKQFYYACGLITGSEKDFEFEPEKTIGRILWAKTTIDHYNNVARAKVEFSGYSPAPVDVIAEKLAKLKEQKESFNKLDEIKVDPAEFEKLYQQYGL